MSLIARAWGRQVHRTEAGLKGMFHLVTCQVSSSFGLKFFHLHLAAPKDVEINTIALEQRIDTPELNVLYSGERVQGYLELYLQVPNRSHS